MSDTLDIRKVKKHGRDLHDEIKHMVKDTQNLIIQPYPNKLVMTPEQYEELKPPGEEYQDDTFIFHTPYNAMDVIVEEL